MPRGGLPPRADLDTHSSPWWFSPFLISRDQRAKATQTSTRGLNRNPCTFNSRNADDADVPENLSAFVSRIFCAPRPGKKTRLWRERADPCPMDERRSCANDPLTTEFSRTEQSGFRR